MKALKYKKNGKRDLIQKAGARAYNDFLTSEAFLENQKETSAYFRREFPNATPSVDLDGVLDSLIEKFAYNVEWMSRRQAEDMKREIATEAFEYARMKNHEAAKAFFASKH